MKTFFNLLLITLCVVFSFGQVSEKNNPKLNNWRIGGGIGINSGNNSYFGVNISPTIGYMIYNNLEVGVSAGYQYGSNLYSNHNLFSIGPYTNFYPIKGVFGKAHYEYFNGTFKNKNSNVKYNTNENALWIGGGYENSGPIRFQIGIMYNILHNNKSIFNSPFRPIGGISVSL